MKKIFSCMAFAMLCASAVHAQQSFTKPQLSAATAQYLDRCNKLRSSQHILPEYVYRKINNQLYISALMKVNQGFDDRPLKALGVYVGTKAGMIWTAQIPVEKVAAVAQVSGIAYIDMDVPVLPSLDAARKYTKADSAQGGYNLPLPLSGKDVILGVIDAGFDFNHPTFYDTTHSAYRVKKVWNQKITGTPPSGFVYGNEMTDTDVIRASGYDTAITTHGTHVAGIAGGSGNSSTATNNRLFRGMAYQSDLVFVGIMPPPGQWAVAGEADILDGMNYIYSYAAAAGKPCVVNLSWGSTIGPHDGNSLFSQACDALTGPGKIFVCAAGNNGQDTVHLQKAFTATDTTVSTFVTFSPYLAADDKRTWVDVWGDTAKTFCFNVKLYDGLNAIDSTGLVCIDGSTHNYSLIGSNGDTCFVTITTVASEYNGKPHAYISLFSKVPDNVCLTTTATDGTVDMWEGYVYPPTGYYGALKSLGYPWAVSGDTKMTVSDIGCTKSAITVAAYTTKTSFTNISGTSLAYSGSFGRLAGFSSFGPTRDNRVKPDIAAPGFAISSAISSYDTSYAPSGTNYDVVITATTSGGRTYPYAMQAGTSMASPCVSGIVAMMLQLNPALTPDETKNLIALNAITDTYTGVLPAAGNNSWGHGKINAYKALKNLAQVMSVNNTLSANPLDCILYPNPNKGSFTLDYVSKATEQVVVTITDVNGRVVSKQNWFVNSGINSKQFSVAGMPKGLYFAKVAAGDKANVIKMIVE